MHEPTPPPVSAVSLSTLVISLDTASFVYTHSAIELYVACIISVAPKESVLSTGSRTVEHFSEKAVKSVEVTLTVVRFDVLVASTDCYIVGCDAV